MSPREPSLEFVCPRCGATIAETIEEVPSYDVLADRESDAQGYAEQTVACDGCDQQFAVGVRNTGACLVANLMNENIHVSVIDDPINTPETHGRSKRIPFDWAKGLRRSAALTTPQLWQHALERTRADRNDGDDFPNFFEEPDTTVTVLSARRTFWEKATALHAEANRPSDSATPQYFSRHYCDLAMLVGSDEGKAAAADLELLATVAKHKATFFRSGWVNYDAARPGTLRLMPGEARIKDLRTDHRAMAPMMFDDAPPAFDDILATIEKFEGRSIWSASWVCGR